MTSYESTALGHANSFEKIEKEVVAYCQASLVRLRRQQPSMRVCSMVQATGTASRIGLQNCRNLGDGLDGYGVVQRC